jgi:hypothetical protein
MKAIATYDGFIGWRGSAQQVMAGMHWETDHPFVQDNPALFRFPDGGDPRTGTGASVPLQPVEEGKAAPSIPEEVPDAQETAQAPLPDDAGEDEELPYSEWPLTELQVECEARGLSKLGNKIQLANRLDADDLAAEKAK